MADQNRTDDASIMRTLVAFMAAMALAWGLSFAFFWNQDVFRKGQIKGVRTQIKTLKTDTEQIKAAVGVEGQEG